MIKILGVGALVVGAVLLFYGVKERDSITSQVTEVLTGAPTDHSVMYLAFGGGLAVIGVGMILFGKGR